ncbi:amino acid adenylation domain-containing protein [Amycolatopsis umgeniensis]|uniref:Amino acid adenylation domain-containing protein n=1 Tax=Amycolatopsis umgeniensis TaxID=336628 RepID=A0A841AVE9_9PSEU|nr:amino acid adenylation domain-containing protein [Amycolatopsis umgeniensis]MBB5851866.1 amino acid adenylation domain-containing protein [Amycolatopsis umgeniensis]
MTSTDNVTPLHRVRSGICLPDLLGDWSRRQPEEIAVVDGDREVTFRGLEEASGELAGHLASLGIGANDPVGLYVEPSADLMIGVWGILSAGAAYLPLSPEYPEDRLRYMLEDSGTGVVVTQPHLAARLAGLVPAGTTIVSLADVRGETGEAPRGPRPDSLAYVIYTSGSTGKPKGVMIEHHSVVSQIRWLQACGHLDTGVTVLQKTPMSFDAAQWEILAPAAGARVVMSAPGGFRDPEALIDTVVEHDVTTLQCVPTLLQALLDTERFATCTTLRKLFSGGEALSRQLAKEIAREVPWARLVNLYGPTECTINATAHLVDPDTIDESAGMISIGVPVDNTQCYVLDADLAPVDIGETGELYIGGVQLARGYLNRPEQTRERFVPNPFVPTERLYRTGDLAYWNPDGTIQFVGRADNQVKLRGYRVELDEITVAIEEHTWVRRAAAVVTDDARTGSKALVACVELNPREAALMDQGNHGGHHQSKASKLQVKAQLSDPGVRAAADLADRPVVTLEGKQETAHQRREVFARKTYRYYEGGAVSRDDLAALLTPGPVSTYSREPGELAFAELGELLRWFGRFRSDERLLPKYSYASPGALYATQLYLETSGLDGLDAGMYYYHPIDHTLIRIAASTGTGHSVHFIGRTGAIEPVYKNNIREVLEFEAGHMVGVFEEILPGYGLTISPSAFEPAVAVRLGAAAEDHYLGTFSLHANDGEPRRDDTELFVQAHPDRVEGLPAGTYRWRDGDFERLSGNLIEAKHVIAINQQVYDRAGFGITAVSRTADEWLEYIGLGTKLHHLQRNGSAFGFMSSGYSSKSGNPLPAARRIDDILIGQGIAPGPSYFFVGGKVSPEQASSEGMREDAVHMKGPAEIIRDELANTLPDYMIPNRVLVLDELPLTANGKVDGRALAETDAVRSASGDTPYVAPSTSHERWLAEVWGKALKYDDVSARDDFFAAGGNSLTAVSLVNRINREFGTRLPLQVVFECPKLADLAARIGEDSIRPSSRLVPLATGGGSPVFCWPGLGGYPMNLRTLASESGLGRSFYGVQAHGINASETPYSTVEEMAKADVAEIRQVQPEGPYTLWGYSFGARVAFETAWQLEQQGQRVDELLLICPGNPEVGGGERVAVYTNPAYLTILLSVFIGSISGPEPLACRETVRDEDGFVTFVANLLPALGEQLIRRIVRIVEETYEFDYSFRELARRRIMAPVTLFKAAGDDYSFVENSSGYSATPPEVVTLQGDHYSVLKEGGVAELASAIRARKGR